MINANAPVVVVEIGRATIPLVSNMEVHVSTVAVSSLGDCYALVANAAALPLVGDATILYITADTDLLYRWDVDTLAYVSVGSAQDLSAYALLTDLVGLPYAPELGADDNYVTDEEKGNLHAPGSDDQDLSGLVPYSVLTDVKDPTGFLNPSGITITGDAAGRTVTLTGDLRCFWRGVVADLTAPFTSSTHPVGDGPYYLYSTDGTTFAWSDVIWPFDSIHAARYYKGRYFRECHGTMPWTVHYNLHNSKSHGTQYISGGLPIAGTFTLNTAGNAAVTPDFAQAVILDEDLPTTIPTVVAGQYAQLYFSGARVDNTVVSQAFPYRVGATYPLLNPVSAGVFSEVELTTGKFFNVYQILVPAAADADSQAVRMMFLQPQFSYSSQSAAEAESPFALDVQGLGGFATEIVLLTRLTYGTNASYAATGKVRLLSANVVTGKLNVSGVGSAATTDENVVAGAKTGLAAGSVATQLEELATEKVNTQDGYLYNPTIFNHAPSVSGQVFAADQNETLDIDIDFCPRWEISTVGMSSVRTLTLTMSVAARTSIRAILQFTTGAQVPIINWPATWRSPGTLLANTIYNFVVYWDATSNKWIVENDLDARALEQSGYIDGHYDNVNTPAQLAAKSNAVNVDYTLKGRDVFDATLMTSSHTLTLNALNWPNEAGKAGTRFVYILTGASVPSVVMTNGSATTLLASKTNRIIIDKLGTANWRHDGVVSY